jgi:1-acyl-sn-glycerol-3-phosphate acyltransferase
MGTYDAMPYDRKIPRTGQVRISFGRPLRFAEYAGSTDRFVLRSATDEIMYEIMMMSGQEYADEYATRVKAEIERGERPRHPDTVVQLTEDEAPAPPAQSQEPARGSDQPSSQSSDRSTARRQRP